MTLGLILFYGCIELIIILFSLKNNGYSGIIDIIKDILTANLWVIIYHLVIYSIYLISMNIE